MCSKCHKPFKGGKCTAADDIPEYCNTLQSKLVELVEKHFPKGHPDRGRATLMMSRYYVAVMVEIDELTKGGELHESKKKI